MNKYSYIHYSEGSLSAYMKAPPAEQHHAMKEGVLYALGCLKLIIRQVVILKSFLKFFSSLADFQ